MTTASKILSAVAAAGLIGGLVIDTQNINSHPGLAALLPAGAIVFGVFLVVFMLEREMAKYDREQALKMERVKTKVLPFPTENRPTQSDDQAKAA
jgi:hypothetical protein